MTINAFHPAYVATHMPEFLTNLRTESRQTKAGQTLTQYVDKTRETKPSHGTLFGISSKVTSVKVPTHLHRPPAKTRSQMMSELVAKKRKTNKNYGTALPESKNIPQAMPTTMKGKKK